MHLFTHQTVKRIQEERMRRSLNSYQIRSRHDAYASDIEEPDAVVIELEITDTTEATHLIGA